MANYNWTFDTDLSTPAAPQDVPQAKLKEEEEVVINEEDSRKAKRNAWALEEIQSPEFYDTLRNYYSYREEDDSFTKMSHADLLDFFYNDRTWGNYNTVNLGKDLYNVKQEVDQERLNEFAYINNVYESLPYFWNDPNRTFGSWVKDMGGALLVDPINLVGYGVGGAAAKVAYRKALQQAVKGKVAMAVNGEMIKLGGKQEVKHAGWQAVKRGALIEGGINAPIAGYHDKMLQEVAIETGVQDAYSLKRTLAMSASGAAFGSIFGGVFAGGGFLLKGAKLQKGYLKNLEDLHNYGVSSNHLPHGIKGKRLFDAIENEKTVKTDWFEHMQPKQKARYLKLAERDASLEVDQHLDSVIDSMLVGEGKNRKNVSRKVAEKEIDKLQPKLTKKLKDYEKKLKNLKLKDIIKDLTPEERILLSIADAAGKHPSAVVNVKLAFLDTDALRINLRKGKNKIGHKQVREMADMLNEDPKKLAKLIKHALKEGKDGQAAAQQLSVAMHARSRAETMAKLIEKNKYENLSKKQEDRILDELDVLDYEAGTLLDVYDSMGRIHAHALEARKIQPEASLIEMQRLIKDPTDPKMKKLKDGTREERKKFWDLIGELDTPIEKIKALKNVRHVNRWDLAAEYVNNNLLSSPDTHILNLLSSLVQTQWKPLEMLFRAAHMYKGDRIRAAEIAREALDTWSFQFIYVAEGLRKAFKSAWAGHPILDSLHNKMDTNIRQGMLGKWFDAMGETFIKPIPLIGKIGHRVITPLIKYPVTMPLRVLAAGDEFLKTIMFRARAASQINSIILRKNPNLIPSAPLSGLPSRTAKLFSKEFIDNKTTLYSRRVRSLYQNYVTNKGQTAVSAADIDANVREITDTDRLLINDPIHYAREGTYTNPAFTRDPVEGQHSLWGMKPRVYKGKLEGKWTGAILGQTSKHKWLRVMGLHFINTPSNLIRWNLQRIPILGRAQFQMRQMLATDKAGNYLNKELAAEAKARLTGAGLVWSAAFIAAYSGKITSGGHRDWKVNREREKATGWLPYAVKTEDGYVGINRFDPFMTPFMVMADIYEGLSQWNNYTDEEMPKDFSDQLTTLAAGTLTGLTRNFSSKFYTKNIIETAEMLVGDGILHTRDMGRFYAAPLARGLFKVTPLSGGLRYTSRVNDDWEREVWNMSDKMNTLDPFKGREHISPQRDMFGVKVERKTGWFFGVDLWSSPFPQTKWKNPETTKFFDRLDRNFQYKPPSYTDKYTGLNLRELQNSDKNSKRYGQTAYDRWLEIKSELKHKITGYPHPMTLQEMVEYIINTKERSYGQLPEHVLQNQPDVRQREILRIVRQFEKVAYAKMYQEYPELEETRIERKKGFFQYIRGASHKEKEQDREENILETLHKSKKGGREIDRPLPKRTY